MSSLRVQKFFVAPSVPRKNTYIRDAIEGGQWGLCHRSVGIFEKCVTEQISQIYPIQRGFFDFFRHFMHSYAIKSSTFTKLGDFSIKYRNFSKLSAHAAPTMCHLTQFFPKKFRKLPFFGAFCAEKCVTERQNCSPLLAVGPPLLHP